MSVPITTLSKPSVADPAWEGQQLKVVTDVVLHAAQLLVSFGTKLTLVLGVVLVADRFYFAVEVFQTFFQSSVEKVS